MPYRPALRRLLCLLLCTAVLLSVCASALSSPCSVTAESSVDELTAQKQALASEQELLASKRDETVSSLEDQKVQSDIIRKQIESKSEEIAINEQLLTTLDTAIADKQASIAVQDTTITVLDAEIAGQQAALRVQLRGISQKNGVLSFIQLILNSRNYADYLIGFKVSEQISERNEQLMTKLEENIQSVETARNQLKTDKAALEIERTQAATVQTELENGKADLQRLYEESNALADSMAQDVDYLNEQIAAMDAQQAALQGTIDAVMEQIRLEEEERRRQEEEEKRRQEEEEAENNDNSEGESDSDDETSDDTADDSDYEEDSDYEDDTGSGSEGDSDTEGDTGSEDGSGTEDDSDYEGDSSDDDDYNSDVESMLWPAPTCSVITSSFKYREQFGRWHNGLDIARYGDAEGEPIVAAAAGKVRYANRYDTWGGGYGLFMMIDHGYDSEGRRIITVYAHCSEVLVYEGLEVEAGELIGYIGDTGNSFGAHLHFEIQVDGTAVDPVSNGYIDTEWIDVLG